VRTCKFVLETLQVAANGLGTVAQNGLVVSQGGLTVASGGLTVTNSGAAVSGNMEVAAGSTSITASSTATGLDVLSSFSPFSSSGIRVDMSAVGGNAVVLESGASVMFQVRRFRLRFAVDCDVNSPIVLQTQRLQAVVPSV
jgi:type IV secretory pathway TrbL component